MPTCTRASFVANSVCYQQFNRHQRISIKIYLNALELAAVGGTNYTLGSGGTLETASVCLQNLPGQENCPPSIYDLLIANNNAVAAGASPAETQTLLATAIQCNQNFPESDLYAQLLQLQCELGKHTGT